jgi:DNA invertase Pin-like site-specific DNA recombinase
MKKAAGYLRCSTNLQDQSIPDQKEAVQVFADSNGIEIIEWFIDEGIIGLKNIIVKGVRYY